MDAPAAPEGDDLPELKARLLSFLGDDSKAYPTQMESKFPRILAKIVSLWGKPGLDVYLGELMVSDRPGRQGFPGDVAMEIFRLSMLHEALGLSKPVAGSGTGWSGIEDPDLFRKALAKDR